MWKKLETEGGFPYYFNTVTKVKQWDHPKYSELKQRLDNCNFIKYPSYRLASKFRILQQALYMDEVSLSLVMGVFERHKLGMTESTLSLESYDLEAILSDIYFAANKQNHTNIDIDFACELTMNFLYNIYDGDRNKNISVSSTKLVLAILSHNKLSELFKFLFNLCADHNNCVTRLKLQSVLEKFTKIVTYLHENIHFGHHLVNLSVDSCFSNSPGLVGIDEGAFILWLEEGPSLLEWLSTLYRMKTSESVLHAVKCSVCKASPIMGLRYKCVKCSTYTQCQNCFLSTRINNSHKLSHPVKEYCIDKTSRDITHLLVKRLCSFLRCSVKLNENLGGNSTKTKLLNSNKDPTLRSSSSENSVSIEPLSTPQAQLQVVILQLELQNKSLQQILNVSGHKDKEMKKYLEEHRLHVAAQIQKLKVLKEYLQTTEPAVIHQVPAHHVQSTPIVANLKSCKGLNLDMLSPISAIPECDSKVSGIQNLSKTTDNSSKQFSFRDLSTWVAGDGVNEQINSDSYLFDYANKAKTGRKSPIQEIHHDLDEVLAKLQQILAYNNTLDESLGHTDNGQLKQAVNEVEGMLTSLIDSVESSRANSAQKGCVLKDGLPSM